VVSCAAAGGAGHRRPARGRRNQNPTSAVGIARARSISPVHRAVGRASPPSSLPIPSGGHGVGEASVFGRNRRRRCRRRLQLTNGDNNVLRPGWNETRDLDGWRAEGARRRLFMAKKNNNNNKSHKDMGAQKIEKK